MAEHLTAPVSNEGYCTEHPIDIALKCREFSPIELRVVMAKVPKKVPQGFEVKVTQNKPHDQT